MRPNYGLMVELKPEFQRKLFTFLLKKYSRFELSKLLKRAPSILYHYKNCRVKNLSSSVVNKSIKLSNLSEEELKHNTIRNYYAEDERKKIFNLGINLRRVYLKKHFKFNIKLKDFIEKENKEIYINTKKWLEKTDWINKIKGQNGIVRNIEEPKFRDGNIILEYEAYTKSTKSIEKFINIMPIKIKVDKDFLYFLGLRYGDGTNGARIGVVNKNFDLIKNTSDYLKKLFPNSKLQGAINIHKKINNKTLKNLKIRMNNIVDNLTIYDLSKYDVKGDYVLYVFIVNEFFNKIYNSLINELNFFFKNLSFRQKGAFLAGFFDAEGNVNKLDKNFRWSQKIKVKVSFIKDLLENEGYHARYDGCNFIIGHRKEFWKSDLELFKKQVLPFIKHPERRKEAIELLNGYYVRDCYKGVVRIVKDNPGANNDKIFSIIKRKRNHRELKALTEAGFLIRNRNRVDESFKYHVTGKGLKWIMEDL